jgi:membrane-bound metal-dependent hydrolase YbcI (DUF457 family)
VRPVITDVTDRGVAHTKGAGMDPLTHVCSGVLIGQALQPNPSARRQTLIVLGLAASAPDLDAISYLWGPQAYAHLHHSYTHTLLGLAVLALLLAGIEKGVWRRVSFTRLFALSSIGLAVHLAGDAVAVWPLRMLWPWAGQDFVLRWTGDFDLAVLAAVGLATGLAATDVMRESAPWILGAVVLILVGYFLWVPGIAGLQ